MSPGLSIWMLHSRPLNYRINNIYKRAQVLEKTVFYSIQCKNSWLAASDLFDMFLIRLFFTKNRVLSVTTFFFENFVSVWEPLIKSWFVVLTTQMPIFVLFGSAGVLLGGAFSLWVSYKLFQWKNKLKDIYPEKTNRIRIKSTCNWYKSKFCFISSENCLFKANAVQIWSFPSISSGTFLQK